MAELYTLVPKANNTATTDPTANDDSADGYMIGSLWVNTATGSTFRATSVTASAAVWQPLIETGPWPSGTLLYPEHLKSAGTQVLAGLSGPFFTPVTVPQKRTADGIGVHTTLAGTAGAVTRLGIYSDTGGLPGTLLLDAGELDLTAVAGLLMKTISISLNAGRYWLCQHNPSTASGTLYRFVDCDWNGRMRSASSLLAGSATRAYRPVSPPAYAAFATSMPTAPSVADTTSSDACIVMLRAG